MYELLYDRKKEIIMKKEEEIKIERLPDSELFIMQTIWNTETPVGTGKVIDLVTQVKDWSRSTIQVLLARLEERGFLDMQKKGRLKYYSPLIQEEDYLAKETKSFVELFYNNSYKKLIASLVQDTKLTDHDYDELLDIINNAKKEDFNE